MATRISQIEAGGTQAPLAPATLESNLSGAVDLSSLLDALIEQAPRLVQSQRNRKMAMGRKKFNMDPKKGIQFLVEHELQAYP